MNTKLISAKSGSGGLCVVPGVVKLWLALQKWIDTFPAAEDFFADMVTNQPLTISADITFDTVTYTDAGWYEQDIKIDSGDWNPSLVGDRGAKYWQTIIPFQIAGHNGLIDQAIDWQKNEKLVAMIEDSAGQKRVLGNKTIYCTYEKADGAQGKTTGDFSGWDNELILPAHCKLSPIYTGTMTPIFSV